MAVFSSPFSHCTRRVHNSPKGWFPFRATARGPFGLRGAVAGLMGVAKALPRMRVKLDLRALDEEKDWWHSLEEGEIWE